jgi:hypothetical protein
MKEYISPLKPQQQTEKENNLPENGMKAAQPREPDAADSDQDYFDDDMNDVLLAHALSDIVDLDASDASDQEDELSQDNDLLMNMMNDFEHAQKAGFAIFGIMLFYALV